MKKLIAFILVGVLLLGVACTPKKTDDQGKKGKQQTEKEKEMQDVLGE